MSQLTESLNFSTVDAFNFHLKKTGHDVERFWNQVDDAIVSITLSKARHISRYANPFKEEHNIDFFELLRFDFIMREEEDEMRLYLMEVKR